MGRFWTEGLSRSNDTAVAHWDRARRRAVLGAHPCLGRTVARYPSCRPGHPDRGERYLARASGDRDPWLEGHGVHPGEHRAPGRAWSRRPSCRPVRPGHEGHCRGHVRGDRDPWPGGLEALPGGHRAPGHSRVWSRYPSYLQAPRGHRVPCLSRGPGRLAPWPGDRGGHPCVVHCWSPGRDGNGVRCPSCRQSHHGAPGCQACFPVGHWGDYRGLPDAGRMLACRADYRGNRRGRLPRVADQSRCPAHSRGGESRCCRCPATRHLRWRRRAPSSRR